VFLSIPRQKPGARMESSWLGSGRKIHFTFPLVPTSTTRKRSLPARQPDSLVSGYSIRNPAASRRATSPSKRSAWRAAEGAKPEGRPLRGSAPTLYPDARNSKSFRDLAVP
jgi:hypothetical protein